MPIEYSAFSKIKALREQRAPDYPVGYSSVFEYSRRLFPVEGLGKDLPTGILSEVVQACKRFEIDKGEILLSLIKRLPSDQPILDVMSYGALATSLWTHEVKRSVCSIGLSDRRRTAEKIIEGATFIEGNILDPATYREVGRYLNKKEASGFSLIVCAPAGASSVLSSLEQVLFLRAYEFLNVGGILITEVPSSRSRGEYAPYIKKLNEIPGIYADLYPLQRSFLLIKGEGSPQSINF